MSKMQDVYVSQNGQHDNQTTSRRDFEEEFFDIDETSEQMDEEIDQTEFEELLQGNNDDSDEGMDDQVVYVTGYGQLDASDLIESETECTLQVWMDLGESAEQGNSQQCATFLRQIIRGLQLGFLDSVGHNKEGDCFSHALKHLHILNKILDVEAAPHITQYSEVKFHSVGLHRLLVAEVVALLLGVSTGIGDQSSKTTISVAIAEADLLNRLADVAFDHPQASTLHCCFSRCLETAARGRCQEIWETLLGNSLQKSSPYLTTRIVSTVSKYGQQLQSQRPSVLSMSIKLASLLKQLQLPSESHAPEILVALQVDAAWVDLISDEGALDLLLHDQTGEASSLSNYTFKPNQTQEFDDRMSGIAQTFTQGQLLSQREILSIVHSRVFNDFLFSS